MVIAGNPHPDRVEADDGGGDNDDDDDGYDDYYGQGEDNFLESIQHC